MEKENNAQEEATDPDFLVNMKLRERYRKNRRDEIRRNQYIKAQERLRKKVFTSNVWGIFQGKNESTNNESVNIWYKSYIGRARSFKSKRRKRRKGKDKTRKKRVKKENS